MSASVRIKKALFVLGVVLWLSAAAWGTKLLNDYSFQPGSTGTPDQVWPASATFTRTGNAPLLVVALHPQCPCSRATLAELDEILVRTAPSLSTVLIFLDDSPDEPAERSALFHDAQKLSGVTLLRDRDGSELKKFGFLTSGEVRLYRADGALVFIGGITGSRGHAGDNPGRAFVIDAVRSSRDITPPVVAKYPVFGCSLTDS